MRRIISAWGAMWLTGFAVLAISEAPHVIPAWGLTKGGAYVLFMALGLWALGGAVLCAYVALRSSEED